ncbi:hypothetical protein BUALT_Bualt05G0014400 [Buddleja alternifolia]|uniref:C3H1-type domain-containing protein n=1 Tax=Buddleja alternifolia TaxID=168488 RepID=A0AAV6XHJ9_9LAMI|nr:hypothetical protein BUALT_Bualt05G0014400 [Buddleja alternifolia]
MVNTNPLTIVKNLVYIGSPACESYGDHDSAIRLSAINKTLNKIMMMIGDPPRSNPTVQIPSWDYIYMEDDRTAHIHSPTTHNTLAALQRYLPSNEDDVVEEDDEHSDVTVDAFTCDNFRMFEFKVKKCARARSHDWTDCPYAHPGEKARRRDPRKYHYSGSACPDFRKGGACVRGDACEYAHGVFECWLHPARYRTQPCKDGTHCQRRVCFFAHTPPQLRVLPHTASSSPKSTLYSPPSSPMTESPPVSPTEFTRLNSVSQLAASIRRLQINRTKMSGVATSWGLDIGSPRNPTTTRPGFASLPSTPIRSVSGLSVFDACGMSIEEEPLMERVESGRELRERIYAKLGRENSLDRVNSAGPVPDFEWVSELVN